MNNNTTTTASLNLTTDSKKKAIVMTKKFAKASRIVGSAEYNMLQQVRRDYPNYRIEIKTTKKTINIVNTLTYQFMELYIKKHDEKHDENKLDDYSLKTAKIEGLAPASFAEVKDWFVENFPEIKKYNTLRDALLAA
ncbi:MAG: hypothetical protein Q4A88_00715 [Clostridia bacterium]|nr:hypothetical protein [Clostridia bacterium]